MHLVSPMIVKKYAGHGKYRYYMKEAYCPECGDSFTVPIRTTKERCRCGASMRFRLIEIDKPDYTDYFEKGSQFRCKDVGRKPKKY